MKKKAFKRHSENAWAIVIAVISLIATDSKASETKGSLLEKVDSILQEKLAMPWPDTLKTWEGVKGKLTTPSQIIDAVEKLNLSHLRLSKKAANLTRVNDENQTTFKTLRVNDRNVTYIKIPNFVEDFEPQVLYEGFENAKKDGLAIVDLRFCPGGNHRYLCGFLFQNGVRLSWERKKSNYWRRVFEPLKYKLLRHVVQEFRIPIDNRNFVAPNSPLTGIPDTKFDIPISNNRKELILAGSIGKCDLKTAGESCKGCRMDQGTWMEGNLKNCTKTLCGVLPDPSGLENALDDVYKTLEGDQNQTLDAQVLREMKGLIEQRKEAFRRIVTDLRSWPEKLRKSEDAGIQEALKLVSLEHLDAYIPCFNEDLAKREAPTKLIRKELWGLFDQYFLSAKKWTQETVDQLEAFLQDRVLNEESKLNLAYLGPKPVWVANYPWGPKVKTLPSPFSGKLCLLIDNAACAAEVVTAALKEYEELRKGLLPTDPGFHRHITPTSVHIIGKSAGRAQGLDTLELTDNEQAYTLGFPVFDLLSPINKQTIEGTGIEGEPTGKSHPDDIHPDHAISKGLNWLVKD